MLSEGWADGSVSECPLYNPGDMLLSPQCLCKKPGVAAQLHPDPVRTKRRMLGLLAISLTLVQ